MAVTGTAAAAQTSSTLIAAPSRSRSGITTIATTTVAIPRRRSQRVTPPPGAGSPSAIAWLTSRAVAICSADPGTMKMMNAEIRAASEP